MGIEDLYLMAEDDDIDVIETKLGGKKSLSVLADGHCAIAIDAEGATSAEEKTMLAHELGHCETLSFYDEDTPIEIQRRCERRADRWAIDQLIPFQDLLEAMRNGIREPWELAEHFGVTEELIRKMMGRYSA